MTMMMMMMMMIIIMIMMMIMMTRSDDDDTSERDLSLLKLLSSILSVPGWHKGLQQFFATQSSGQQRGRPPPNLLFQLLISFLYSQSISYFNQGLCAVNFSLTFSCCPWTMMAFACLGLTSSTGMLRRVAMSSTVSVPEIIVQSF